MALAVDFAAPSYSSCRWWRQLLLVLLAALLPVPAWGQQTIGAWTNLRVVGLPMVYVLDQTGRETSGRLLRLDDSALVILVDGQEQRFEAARVKQIARRGDSLKNGAIIGAVVGVALGLATGGLAECAGEDGRIRGCGAGVRTALTVLSSAIYASVGTAIDALRTGRTLLYEIPDSAAAATRLPTSIQRARDRHALTVSFPLNW